MQPGRARTSRLEVPPLLLAWWVGWVAPVRLTYGVQFVVSRPSAALRAHVCEVSTAPWRCSPVCAHGVFCVVRLRCPEPLRPCSALCRRPALCCACGVLGYLASVHRRARSVRCAACALFLASWLLCTSVLARSVVLPARCPGSLGSCSPVVRCSPASSFTLHLLASRRASPCLTVSSVIVCITAGQCAGLLVHGLVFWVEECTPIQHPRVLRLCSGH